MLEITDEAMSEHDRSTISGCADLAQNGGEILLRAGYLGSNEREKAADKILLAVRHFVYHSENGDRGDFSIIVRKPKSHDDSVWASPEKRIQDA